MKTWYKAKAKPPLSKLLTVKEGQLVNYKVEGDKIHLRFADGTCSITKKEKDKYIEFVMENGKPLECRPEVSEYIENELNPKYKKK